MNIKACLHHSSGGEPPLRKFEVESLGMPQGVLSCVPFASAEAGGIQNCHGQWLPIVFPVFHEFGACSMTSDSDGPPILLIASSGYIARKKLRMEKSSLAALVIEKDFEGFSPDHPGCDWFVFGV